MSDDQPVEPCVPTCQWQESEADMRVCDICGSLWLLRDVTEVDPVTFQPVVINRAWFRR